MMPSYSDTCCDVMRSGHSACPGCGQAISMRLVLRAIGTRAIVVTVPSCLSIIAGPFPNAAVKLPMYHAAFEVAAASAAGISNQGRYTHLRPDQIESIQSETDRIWQDLKDKAGKHKPPE